MTYATFTTRFRDLTGSEPMSWQTRMFSEHFMTGDCSNLKIVDLPTGLGKTMIMALWLIGREFNPKLPRRLVYVVDRRTVVDQATDLAEDFAYLLCENPDQYLSHVGKRNPQLIERQKANAAALSLMRDKLGGDLCVSTLRGQLADNRRWSQDPSKPAIIVGTVDLIGSALLFSGYRSSYKRRALEAGLLGQDSLLVLDEAHLSKPFEKLLSSIEAFQRHREDSVLPVKPMRVIRMSATSENSIEKARVFTLKFDGIGCLTDEDAQDHAIARRFNAVKRLKIRVAVEKNKLNDVIKSAAIELAESTEYVGKRIIVFVRSPHDAKKVADLIRNHVPEKVPDSGSKTKKEKTQPYIDKVSVLTGTMRGLERDELVKEEVFRNRWLKGDLTAKDSKNQEPVFLISTSAGEVGFDLNADHMVSDATTIDSFIQRLGRVNRRGTGDASVILCPEKRKEKEGKQVELNGFDLAIDNAVKLLAGIVNGDLSPKNIVSMKQGEWTHTTDDQTKFDNAKSRYELACSPDVATVPLTDMLLDNWSMTSITERMPGRPDVAQWLRGIDEEQSQTTIAWRAELDLPFNGVDIETVSAAIFAKHRVRPHESLTVNTRYLIDDFFKKLPKPKPGEVDPRNTLCAIRLSRGKVFCQTIDQLIEKPNPLYADATLILPASFGGLNCGMLDAGSVWKKQQDETAAPQALDIADYSGYEADRTLQSRLRVLLKRDPDRGTWRMAPFPSNAMLPRSIDPEARESRTTPLIANLRAAGFRVRHIQLIRLDDEGEPVESLVCLAPTIAGNKSQDQSLNDHVSAVERHAKRINYELQLPEDHPLHIAATFAAKWHDEGKKAVVWQRFANNADPEYGNPLGKMARARDPKSLRGYRHEFGSLLRLQHPERHDTRSTLPHDPDVRDLALHLIAIHHGGGRPSFDMAVYDPFTDEERDDVHVESIRRFAKLQRKYGWWYLAWLENVLRCADALASSEVGSAGDEDEPAKGGAQ